MNIFYGLDSTLINYAATKFINNQISDNDFAAANVFYLDQETIKDQIISIINKASTINIFSQKKIIIINDYYSVLKNNSLLATELMQQLSKLTNNLIIIKVLTSEVKPPIIERGINCILVKSYSKQELKKWLVNKNNEYSLSLNELETELITNLYPNNLNIIDNELQKLKNLDQDLILPIIKNSSKKYISPNIYRLIDNLLLQNYSQFWTEYRSYWQKINYDNFAIFNLVVARLELIRNMKLLRVKNISESEMLKKLEISLIQFKSLLKYKLSIIKINQLLCFASDIDNKIKNGKTSKNIAIELFFLKI